MKLVPQKVLDAYPRSYVGVALEDIARRRLRRARRAAALTEDLDRKVGEVVELHKTELPYPDGPLASRRVEE